MSVEERRAKTLLTAAWVAPMDDDDVVVLRDAGVVHAAGRIVAVGDAKALRRAHPDAIVEDLGDVVLLPGLVNAHCHLELTCVERPMEGITFVSWVMKLIEQMRRAGSSEPGLYEIGSGFAQCLTFGVTSVGDITTSPRAVRRALTELQGGRVVSYGEVRAMATRRTRLDEHVMAASEPNRSKWPRIGISPHAPYSVEPDGYRRCLSVAKREGLPLTTHLAETPDEREFLASHTGPLRDLWESIGGWDDDVPRFDGGPIRYAEHLGLLDYPMTSLAHVNYCDDAELAILAAGRASVVYCPRTHRYFGHPPHRWREMLVKGINVAVGTDSCASSPDLNLFDDLRLLHEIAPEVPAGTIWSLATRRAARAVGMEDEVGTLTAGKYADFVAFASRSGNSLAAILDERSIVPAGVWIGGQRVT